MNLNDYLLELRRVPESILRAFADSGWTYAVDFQHLASLTRRYGTSCTGAADYDKKHIYVSEAKATVHEFGHFLDSMLGFPPGRSSFTRRRPVRPPPFCVPTPGQAAGNISRITLPIT